MSSKLSFQKFQQSLSQTGAQIAFIQDPATIRLLTHFSTEPHERIVALIVAPNHTPILFTPALEAQVASLAEPDYRIISYQDHENPFELLSSAIQREFPTSTNWAVEKKFVSLYTIEQLKHYLPNVRFSVDLTQTIDDLRLRKDAHEIQLLKKSGSYADKAVQIGIEALTEGITELEVVAKIEYEMKKLGISSMSFETMVLFGDHAADPHGVPSTRKLKQNEWVLFDLGTMYQGYASDMTRTIFWGNPHHKKAEQQKIFEIVKEAHDLAIQHVKPGVTASFIDAVARNYIAKFGYGDYFIHRLGHGIGQSCHEFPSIMTGNDLVLEEGMCFSIEPGIYIPNVFGARVEDCLVVTKDGCELFTHFPQTI